MINPVVKKTGVALTLAALTASCSNAGNKPNNPAAEAPPVTLKIYMWDALFQDEAFQKLIADPIKKKPEHYASADGARTEYAAGKHRVE